MDLRSNTVPIVNVLVETGRTVPNGSVKEVNKELVSRKRKASRYQIVTVPNGTVPWKRYLKLRFNTAVKRDSFVRKFGLTEQQPAQILSGSTEFTSVTSRKSYF